MMNRVRTVLRLAVTALLLASCSGVALEVNVEDGRGDDAGTADGRFEELTADVASPDLLPPEDLQEELAGDDLVPGWECVEAEDCLVPGDLGVCQAMTCTEDHRCVAETAVDGTPCVPDDLCFASGSCSAGECQGELPVDCDDKNPCTEDGCDAEAGCVHAPMDGECDDGDPCTEGDSCLEGTCSGTPVVCDDGNPCTKDSCDEIAGCLFANQEGECDDGDPCTAGDSCLDGNCVSAENLCECKVDEDCYEWREDNACLLDVLCNTDAFPYTCEEIWMECEQPESVCLAASCNPDDGLCVTTPANDGGDCEEPLSCAPEGTCQEGLCVGEPPPCDDGNPCTADGCVPGQGCTFEPMTAPCDDGDPCTVNDYCNAEGLCTGQDFGCQELPTLGVKLTSLIFEAPGFCLPMQGNDPACLDATALVNSFIDDDIHSKDSPLTMLGLFDPFDIYGDGSLFSLGPGQCAFNQAGDVTSCSFTGKPAAMQPVLFTTDAPCETEGGEASSPPCFHVAGDGFEVGVMDIVIPIAQAQVTGTFLGMPEPDAITEGHIEAFLYKSVADAINVTLPLMPPYKLSALLEPTALTEKDGKAGWPLLIHYTATAVPVAPAE
jgi:hypothetical protein